MMIAGYAVGAQTGIVYVRSEYPLAVKHLSMAISQATDLGLLGSNILGSRFDFNIEIFQGAGAFVCGESTALVESIEGKRGLPKSPPRTNTSIEGLWGKPTVLNNVETFACVPMIIRKGAEWFNHIGTEKSKGTKVFALTGDIKQSGLVEIPMGMPLREIVFDIGGGIAGDKKFKAVQTGGPSGGCIPESLLDLPVDYESLAEAGSIMGSGGMVVMDESTCMADVVRYFLNFTKSESCGQCTPCREGLERLYDIVDGICKGQGSQDDIERLEALALVIQETSLCGLGQSAPNPVLTVLEHFREEIEAHVVNKQCPAGVCSDLIHFDIDADKCKACGLCRKACPVAAIQGKPKVVHEIIQDLCIRCGTCYDVCPKKFSAVIRT
jgi:NADH:ubiquinone oxidoreductase subunit F (NADH-binding)